MQPSNSHPDDNPLAHSYRNPFQAGYRPAPIQQQQQNPNVNQNMNQAQPQPQQWLPPQNPQNQAAQPQAPFLDVNSLLRPIQNLFQPQNPNPNNNMNQGQNQVQPQNIPQNQNQQPQIQVQPQNQSQTILPNPNAIFGPSICNTHHKPFNHVCKAEACPQRLLCDLCVPEHSKGKDKPHKDIITMKELLDVSLSYQLELYAKEEKSIFKPLDDRYYGVCSTISSSFESLKAQINELLVQSEAKAKAKAKDYFLKPRPKKWVALMEEYNAAKQAYLNVRSEGHTKVLDEFIEVVNKVQQHKKEKEEDSLQEILETQKEEMDKVLQRFKESVAYMMDRLFNSAQESALKVTTNGLTYHKEVKTDAKFLINTMVYVPRLDQIVTGSENGTISAWTPLTFDHLVSYRVHSAAIDALIYLEKEALIVTGSKDNSIKMFPVTSAGINVKKALVYTGHTDAVRSLLYLEGEDRIASAGEDPDIRIWSLRSGNLDNTINTKGWKSCADEMAFIRPERWIVVGGKKEIKIFDYVTGDLLITQGAVKAIGSMDYLLEKKILMVQDDNDKITLWKVDGEKKKLKKERRLCLPYSLKKPAYFKCIEMSDLVLVSTGTNKMAVFSLSTGALLKEIETKLQSTTCITWLRSERRILVGDSGSNLLGVLQY